MISSRTFHKLSMGSLLALTASLLIPAAAHDSHSHNATAKNVPAMPAHADSDCGPSSALELTPAQKQARLQNILRPVSGAKSGSYAEVSRLITRQEWKDLSRSHRKMVAEMLRTQKSGQQLPAYCFAPGTDLKTIRIVSFARRALSPLRVGGRWTQTATNASTTLGKGITLRWSIVPDGTPTSAGAGAKTSNLQARTRTAFGTPNDDSVLVARFTAMFARYEQLTGIRYIRELNDDGVALGAASSSGVAGTRGDVRISGTSNDGPYGVLAVNYFPGGGIGGDMIIDTDEVDGIFTADIFRNVIAHEHGHGLGLNHTCPSNNSKLMEPFANSRFTHAQLDDILGTQRNYGDVNEAGAANDTIANATNIGSQATGSKTYGDFPSDALVTAGAAPGNYRYITTQQPLGVGGSGDTDLYKFTVGANSTATITLRPLGEPYLEGAQNGDSSCSAGAPLNPKTFSALKVELVNGAGQVVAQSSSGVAGANQTINAVGLSGTGPFYVRVSETGADANQLYNFDLVIGTRANAAPNVSVSIAPTTPTTTSTLTATATANDPDAGDSVALSYQWFRNNVAIVGATTSTLNLANISGVTAGDIFRVEVTASDGTPPPSMATDSVLIREAPSLVVTTLTDVTAQDGQNSLREAITYAGTLTGAQTISFQAGLTGTMNLASELPAITKALTFTGRAGLEISGQNNTRITTIAAAGDLTATNLVFKNGRSGSSNTGGLFLINGGKLTATDCILKDSSAQDFGGAAFATANSVLAFTRCTISNNTAFGAGAFWLDGASASFDTCTLSANKSTGGGNNGGVAYVKQSNPPTVVNGAVNLVNCQVNANTSAGGGGAIYIVANGSTGSARNCTFSGNTATGNGGAWYDGNQNTPFSNCTFSGNTAGVSGGGIFDFQASRVVNCTFKGNVAPQGSAFTNDAGIADLQNNVFDATGQAVSLAQLRPEFGPVTSRGNNIASDGGGGFLTQTSDRINLVPKLGALADNGGNVTTIAPAADSPAVNKGRDVDATDINNNGNATESLSAILVTDGRGAGFPRVVGGTIDIGAFESNIANRFPLLNNATYSTPLGVSFSQQLSGSDPDGDTLTYVKTVGTLPPGIALSGNGLLNGIPTQNGQFAFSVNVNDGKDTLTARFIIIVSSMADAIGPNVSRPALNASYTRDQLADLVYQGTIADVAGTGVTPTGVKQLLFQLRRESDKTAYSGTSDGFTTNLNRGYYSALLSDPVPNTTAGARPFKRTFSTFIPPASVLTVGPYSLVIAAQDVAGNWSIEVVPINIITAPPVSRAPQSKPSAVRGGASLSGGNS